MNRYKVVVRRIVSVLVFLLVGLLIYDRLAFIVRRKAGEMPDMINVLYSVDKNTADLVTIGSSHGYCSIQNNVLWDDYGITSLSMCSPSQTIATSYYVLKETLKYQKPKVVLLETYYFWFADKYDENMDQAQLRKAMDNIHLGKVKQEWIDDLFPDLTWKEKLSYYIPFIKYHSRWNDLQDFDFNVYHFLRGTKVLFNVTPIDKPEDPDPKEEIPEVDKEYFMKIKKLCEENGIQLVAFSTPFIHTEYTRDMNAALESYFAENDVPFIYHEKLSDYEFDYANDFYDTAHLNVYGGTKYTRYLGELLKDTYQLEDHRQDPSYASYASDYEKYLKYYEEQEALHADEDITND